MVEVVDVGQQKGVMQQLGQAETGPGEVRPDLHITFTGTLDRLDELITKAELLGEQAETYWWTMYRHELNVSGNVSSDISSATGKMCLAAYPMLDEILERLAYVCDEEYVALGSGTGDTAWDSSATRSYYYPFVAQVCTALRDITREMRGWDKNAEGWKPDGVARVRTLYGDSLLHVYTKARALVNQLGPLWPDVICNGYPRTQEALHLSGYNDYLSPTSLSLTGANTRRASMNVTSGPYTLRASTLYDWTDYIPEASELLSTIKKPFGGFLYIRPPLAMRGDIAEGYYEIIDVTDESLIIVNNGLYADSEIETPEAEDVNSDGFIIRLIRKAEPTVSPINVQYNASMMLVEALTDPEDLQQKYFYSFNSASNEHLSPKLVIPPDKGIPPEKIPYWRRYGAGGVYQGSMVADVRMVVKDISSDTEFVSYIGDAVFDINGTVRCLVKTGAQTFIGGAFTEVNGETRNRVALFDEEGQHNVWFQSGEAGANAQVNTILVYGDGSMMVGGAFTQFNQMNRNLFVKLLSDGKVDTDFSTNLTLYGDTVHKIGMDGSSRTLIAGNFGHDFYIENLYRQNMYRQNMTCLGSDGQIDKTFLWSNVGANNGYLTSAKQSDGKIIVGGEAYFRSLSIHGYSFPYGLARFDTDGELDFTFTPPEDLSYARVLCVNDSDEILIVGYYAKPVPGYDAYLVLLDSDGTELKKYEPILPAASSVMKAIPHSSGYYLINGGGGVSKIDTALETELLIDFTGYTGSGVVRAGVIDSDGYLVLCGQVCFFRIDTSDDTYDATFTPSVTHYDFNDIKLQTYSGTEYYILGGYQVNSPSDGVIFRIDPSDGSEQCNVVTLVHGRVQNLLILDSTEDVIAIFKDQPVGGTRIKKFDNDATLTVDGAWAVSTNYVPSSIHETGSNIFICGYFFQVNDFTRRHCAWLDTATGDLADPWPDSCVGANKAIYDFAVDIIDDSIYIVGEFTYVNEVARGRIAKIDNTGALDAVFMVGESGATGGPVRCVALEYSNNPAVSAVWIGGEFTNVNGDANTACLARLNQAGTTDTECASSIFTVLSAIYAIAVLDNQNIFIGGNFTVAGGGETRSNFAKLTLDGTWVLDTSFGASGDGCDGPVYSILIENDGGILIAGDFDHVTADGDEVERSNMVRLLSDGTLDAEYGTVDT